MILLGETKLGERNGAILQISPLAKSTKKIINYTWADFLADVGGIFKQFVIQLKSLRLNNASKR